MEGEGKDNSPAKNNPPNNLTLIFFLCQKGDDKQNKFGNPIV